MFTDKLGNRIASVIRPEKHLDSSDDEPGLASVEFGVVDELLNMAEDFLDLKLKRNDLFFLFTSLPVF